MAKIKLTRPELKRQRDALKRFQRFLPMLKLRQSQLQTHLNRTRQRLEHAEQTLRGAERRCRGFAPIATTLAGVDIQGLCEPTEVVTHTIDIAGIAVPELDRLEFPDSHYSLFATPVWIDGAICRLRERRRYAEQVAILQRQFGLIERELRKTIQRVNLFEQVKIPEAKDAIRRIRIRLGDEMTSAIGRSKIAKGKLAELAVADAAAELGEE